MANERATDEQLMTRAGTGDLDAFGQLVERHHQRALNLAFRLSGDSEMARDIAQESFLRILKGAHRYEPRARFTTYLYTVVRNLVVEMSRRTHRRREVPLEAAGGKLAEPLESDDAQGAAIDPAAHLPGAPEAPDDALDRGELRRRLRGALSSLPDDLRDAFVLTEIEGLSYGEVARVCGCPEGTVASRKHHAVERLRRALAVHDPTGES